MLSHNHTEHVELDILDKQIITAIQDGLALASRPFEPIARQLGISEQKVLQRLERLKENGTIKRLGVVVRHRELGFRANAMVVWNIPDYRVAKVAQQIASFDCVTLCYQRPRRLPDWPYNLFSMIHGKDRKSVLQRLDNLIEILSLQDINYRPLFSTRRFKQRGAHFLNADKIFMESKNNNLPQVIHPAVKNDLNGFSYPVFINPVCGL
jgi:DNA-binding Lrp family transcriptional regulator